MPKLSPGSHLQRLLAGVVVAAGFAAFAAGGLQDRAGFLWIAESGGLLNIATDSGAVRFEVAQTLGTSAVGVNDYNGDVWSYGARRLRGFDRTGVLLVDVETPVPIHGGDPAELVVDGGSGNLWLAIKRELYRYDLQGNLRQTLTLPRSIVAATLDRDRSILWVAQDQQLRLYDADGALVRSVDFALTDKIGDVSFDRRRGEIWMALADRLQRYDPQALRLAEVRGNYVGSIAPDGADGLWQARDGLLLHYDLAGATVLTREPFADQPDKAIVDLVADAHDASVWVASRKSLAHYAIDGERLVYIADVGDGVIRRLSRGALYADLDPPEIAIAAPIAGSLLNDNRPAIMVNYFDLGVGVDVGSLRFSAGDTPVSVSCNTATSTATCVPAHPLPDGEVILRATIADRVLNVSSPAEVRVVIDTLPPEVVVTSPAAAITNQPSQVIQGHLNEAGSVRLDGVALVLDDAFHFAAPRTLGEGSNVFELSAVDRAGNEARRTVTIALDTLAPATPALDLIEVGEPGGGHVPITGAPGSVEAGARVRITNLRTGESVLVTAAGDGSFAAAIDATAGDEISIVVLDAAGNTSGVATAAVPVAIGVSITEPVEGAEYQHDFALVAGTFKGPLNASIAVNGVVASVVVEGNDVRFYAIVPLQAGWNDLEAVAGLQSGARLARRVRVQRVEAPLSAKATPALGLAPRGVKFDVTGGFDFNDQIRYDFNGDGRFDLLTGASISRANFASYSYTAPGIYRPVIQVSRYNYIKRVYEVIYRPVLAVVVLSQAQIDQYRDRVLRSVWAGLNASLLAGDLTGALTAISTSSHSTYGPVFEALLPRMQEVLGGFTDIEPIETTAATAEYAVMNAGVTRARIHIITFIQGPDGIWRIDQI